MTLEILKIIVLACTLNPTKQYYKFEDVLEAQKKCRVEIINCVEKHDMLLVPADFITKCLK